MITSSTTNAPYYRRREPGPDAYTQDYWAPKADPDGVVRDRTKEREQYLSDVAQELEFVRSLPPGRILDYGCGLGWFLDALGDGWNRNGVEESAACLEWCRRYHFNVYYSDDEAAGVFASMFGRYDVLLCHHVIEHLNSPEELIGNFVNMICDGGHLIISTPDFESPCAKRFGANYRLLHDPTHISLFSQDGLLRLLRDTGFSVDRVEYPFPERYATPENFARWNDTSKISPPWPGNFITAYCRKV